MVLNGEPYQRIFRSGKQYIATIAHWVKKGQWERINALLVEQVRTQSGRTEQPSLGMIDAQSVKRGQRGQLEQGFDGYKKVKGRKRHVVVDVMGLMLGFYVSAANAADGKAAPAVLVPVLELYKRLEKVLALPGLQGRAGQMLTRCLQMRVGNCTTKGKERLSC